MSWRGSSNRWKDWNPTTWTEPCFVEASFCYLGDMLSAFPRLHFTRNSGSLRLRLSYEHDVSGGSDMCNVHRHASTPSPAWQSLAAEVEGDPERRGQSVWVMMLVSAMIEPIRGTGKDGEQELDVARCCQPQWLGLLQHLKYQNRLWWWWSVYVYCSKSNTFSNSMCLIYFIGGRFFKRHVVGIWVVLNT